MPLGNEPARAVLRDLVELALAQELDQVVEVGQEGRLAAADRHPLGGQRGAADLPAAVDVAEHQIVGHEHVVDEHGVEHLIAGELTQRPHLDSLAGHVQQEVRDAIVFWSARLRPGQQHAPMSELRGRGPDLLAGDPPAAVDLGGLGGQAGQVRARARLGKQLAPDHFAAERRRQETLLLLIGTERDDRRHQPRRDTQGRSSHLSGGELLLDDDLLDRGRRPAPRLGQMRRHPTALGDCGGPFFARNRLQRSNFRADLAAELLGLGVQVDVDLAHPGAGRCVDDELRVIGGATECRDDPKCPTVVDVGVVLPGETDAAVHLDAVLRAPLRGGRGQGRGDSGREFRCGFPVFNVLVEALVDRPGGVPHRGDGPLGVGGHLRALVLDALELPDRPAELLADLRIRRGGVGGPAGDADGLGRQQGGHQCARGRHVEVAQDAVGRDLDGVGAHMRDRPQRVDALDGHDLEGIGVDHHPLGAAGLRVQPGDRQHQQRRLRRGGHRARLAADHQRVAVGGRGKGGLQRVRGDRRPRRHVAEHLCLRVVGRDQRAGDRRRHERPGHRATAELGDHHGELEDSEALPANRLGQVNAVQALFGGRLPIRRRVRDRRLQRLVQHFRRGDPFHQGADRISEVFVLGCDRDRHDVVAFLK